MECDDCGYEFDLNGYVNGHECDYLGDVIMVPGFLIAEDDDVYR